MIDITTTGCLRPDVFERTLKSFRKYLFKDTPVRLVINIDPVGVEDGLDEMLAAAWRTFPKAETKWRFPETPDFPSAFKWVWENAQSEFVFHLEDDWELLRPIDLNEMIALMEKYPELAVLRLPYRRCDETANKSWNKFLPWNGEFFEVEEHDRGLLGFSGHPSLIKRAFIIIAMKLLREGSNPEKCIKWKPAISGYGKFLQRFRYGVFGRPGDSPAVRDIGAGWAWDHGFKKEEPKSFFTKWIRRPDANQGTE